MDLAFDVQLSTIPRISKLAHTGTVGRESEILPIPSCRNQLKNTNYNNTTPYTYNNNNIMGRYSSVQAYSDQQNTRTTSYEQEKGNASNSVKTEKVHNPYGSTAGAGSGEFHIYRHARAREQQRMNALDEVEQEQNEEEEFQGKIQGWKSEEETRLEKKRKKRARGKAAKVRKKNLSLSGVAVGSGSDSENNAEEDEFEYTPVNAKHDDNETKEESEVDKNGGTRTSSTEGESAGDIKQHETDYVPPPPFKNDGSFLEMMKKKMQEESSAKAGAGNQ